MNLFQTKGFYATTVVDILAEAKANSGSLYYHYPSKDALLSAVLTAYREGIQQMLLAPAWAGVDDAIDKVFALLGAYRQFLVETDCLYGCPIGSVALELKEPEPAIRELLCGNFDAWVGAVEQCFRDAGAGLPESVDRAALARFVLSVMEGSVMQARTHRSLEPFDASVRMLRDYLDRLQADAQSR